MSRTFSSCWREMSRKGQARRTRSWSSSTAISSCAEIATICCASTSSGFRGTRVSSIRPSFIRCATTADSRRSARNFGKMRPFEASSRRCPARPTRCRPRATDFGDSTWMTRSTAPMSIPSSSDEVATRQGISPFLSSSSTSTRCSRASEPWCARAISFSASSLRRRARRSASRRLLTKTIVERCSCTSSSRAGWIEGQMEPPSPGSRMSSRGTTTRRSSSLRVPASTSSIGLPPETKRPISSSGRWVADRPTRCTGSPTSRSSRSRLSARCAPRLEPATACTSSTITTWTPPSVSRARDVSMRKSDSGVVIRMSDGDFNIAARSFGGVSPVRTATESSDPMPASGPRRLRSTS